MAMNIIDLYFSEEEFSIEREREIAEEYERYMAHLDEQADRAEYDRMVEM